MKAPRRSRLVIVALAVALAGCRARQEPPPPLPPIDRESALLSSGWRFAEDAGEAGPESPGFDDTAWPEVRVPHTWGRAERRAAWYRTRFRLAPRDAGKRVYLRFEGVATLAEVFLNGVRLGGHVGAFTAFVFDATDQVRPGDNLLAVRVNNTLEDTGDSLPSGHSKQLYHMYGGIYRKAWLLKTNALHVDPTDHAASGVYVTPRNVGAGSADLDVRTLVRNSGPSARTLVVRNTLVDAEGLAVQRLEGSTRLEPGGAGQLVLSGRVDSPRLWSPKAPHLYSLRTELLADGRVVDALTERVGFRDFRLEGGRFLLNGEEIAIRGIGKHQETERHASAVTDEELREDFAHLRDLGVNMVRLAHYPHARLEYDLADEAGILVWAENGHSNPAKVRDGVGETITREMIRQNYNHPSIVIWSVGNEAAFIRVRRYSEVARQEDPGRIVGYASNTGKMPRKAFPSLGLTAHNVYRGWYRGTPWDFEERALETRFVAETGGGAVVSTHTDYAEARHVVDEFEPEEYRQLLAEAQCQVVFRDRPREIPMYLVWILREFAIGKYKGRNTKGLLTYSNFKKDAYYLYQSFLRPDLPVVHITSKTYFLRRGGERNGVKVYSNRAALTLTVNGEPQGERRNGEHAHDNGRKVENVFYWPSRLRRGRNEIRAEDGEGHADSAVVYYYGGGAEPAAEEGGGLVRELRSSNPRAPAYFVDVPVAEQWPFYYELDGTADNTFDRLPEELRGARLISTPRLSKPANKTEISFRLGRDASVYVMSTEGGPMPALLAKQGFLETGATGAWRDDELRLLPFRLQRRVARAGERILVPAAVADYVVLVLPAP